MTFTVKSTKSPLITSFWLCYFVLQPWLKGRVLLELQSAVNMEGTAPMSNTINVVRVLDSATTAFSRRAFDSHRWLDVVCVDAFGDGEGFLYNGDPTQEFFRVLMQAIINLQYFVGPQEEPFSGCHRYVHLSKIVRSRLYKLLALELMVKPMIICLLFQFILG